MILLIVATDTKNGIAKDGHQPWRLIADERYFQDATLSRGAAVIMGRTTFETLKGPLPGRQNFVASRSSYQADGIEVVSDITGFLADFTGDKDIWVIGGAAIYSLTLSLANELYITKISADFNCDQFFPEYKSLFKLSYQSEEQSENGLKFSYTRYLKNDN